MIEYDKLGKSLKNLELQLENHRGAAGRPELTDLDREALAESVIQRFETGYDMLWKHLKRYLVEELGLPEVPNSPKPVFRLASENQLLSNSLEQWFQYAQARTDTAHDYSGEKAADRLELIPTFLDDAIGLYQTMTGASWE